MRAPHDVLNDDPMRTHDGLPPTDRQLAAGVVHTACVTRSTLWDPTSPRAHVVAERFSRDVPESRGSRSRPA